MAKSHEGDSKKEKRKAYEKELLRLQVELVKLQLWVKHTGARVIVLFEGRDAAGKGGVIKRLTEHVSPRVFRVVALPAPTPREKTQIYLQRYLEHFPAAGEIVIFDRSWYNRAGVEHVMGFCSDKEYKQFLNNTPLVEKWIIDSGIQIIKYWFEVSEPVQAERFKSRISDPLKTWKLSDMDLESHKRWYDYSHARDVMFKATDNKISPWHVVPANDKKTARLNCIAHFLSMIPYKEIPRKKVKLPKRRKSPGYQEPKYNYRTIPQKYAF